MYNSISEPLLRGFTYMTLWRGECDWLSGFAQCSALRKCTVAAGRRSFVAEEFGDSSHADAVLGVNPSVVYYLYL